MRVIHFEPLNVQRWAKKDLWNLFEAAQILCGLEPGLKDENFTIDALSLCDSLHRSQLIGLLKPFQMVDGKGYHHPVALIHWAIARKEKIDPGLVKEVVAAHEWILRRRDGSSPPAFPPARPREVTLQPDPSDLSSAIQEPDVASEGGLTLKYRWVPDAKAIGQEVLLKHPRLNIEKIAAKVRDEMERRRVAKAPGHYTTRSGIVPSAGTIKRHALTGLKS